MKFILKKQSEEGCLKTKRALFWINILNEPLSALYTLLPFILVKDLHATALQISLFVSLRPLLSVFSFYWGPSSKETSNKLIYNVMGACVLTYLPFLFFAMSGNVWLILFSAGFYQLFHKAGLPAWIEILQRNIPKKPREDIFSLSYLLSFVESGLLGLFVGYLLDLDPALFRILLVAASLLGLCGLFFLKGLPLSSCEDISIPRVKEGILRPLKEGFSLVQSRRDFKIFQMAFTIGGAALMLMAPVLPIFYASTLSISHSTITIARFVFMALGVICSSFFWKQLLIKKNMNELTGWILLGFGVFPFLLLVAQFSIGMLYAAFFIYGIAQAGSHLVWNLSGPFFAQGQNSALFTRVNLLMLGLRGMIFPFLGGILCQGYGQQTVICIGMLACFGGTYVISRMVKQPAPAAK
ncbi:MAG TPA: MFS transporter [Rhabdochlamydiaceae bacterium]|nr:MFS transporter [Rhabdochlamydiaceae bacterium]